MDAIDVMTEVTNGVPQDTGSESMVRSLAWRVLAGLPKGSGIEMADLIQAGNVGLIQAAKTFDLQNGAPFSGYARFRIRGEMLDTVRRNAGRGSGAPACLAGTESEDSALENTVPTPPEASPLGRLATSQRAAILGQEIDRLPPRYRTVVRLRYTNEFSLREIGAVLRVKESRVCQLHRSALGRLRRALSTRGVRVISHLM